MVDAAAEAVVNDLAEVAAVVGDDLADLAAAGLRFILMLKIRRQRKTYRAN